ncbi:hypothetical protein M885DRAFT_570318 [Pelagophyceae sp. CCMP2097]|nr:hypothetical protein M885DRAFT_570318 [Pelagophyceae sp. CCMP2097]
MAAARPSVWFSVDPGPEFVAAYKNMLWAEELDWACAGAAPCHTPLDQIEGNEADVGGTGTDDCWEDDSDSDVNYDVNNDSDGGGKGNLKEGDKIEARYRGREKFYPGKITRDRGDGTFDIDYDDGEKETRVDEKLIRSKDGGASSSGGNGSLMVGDKVEARYRGREKFYTGKIIRDRRDGTFDIDYDDGEKETRVDEKLIRSKDGGSSSSAAKGGFMEGDKVEARYRGKEKFYPGKISRDRGDRTYDINYDDGEREIRVDEKLIRSKDGGASSIAKGGLKEGEKVEARYRGREKFYTGIIIGDRRDGTFDIDYDDGEKETRVDEKLIRSKDGGASSSGNNGSLMVGDKVEARYRGREKFYTGKIIRNRGDGTFDIDYDDGEKETRVDEKLIRSKDGSGGAAKNGFKEGEKVEARYKGREKLYPGKISRDRGDGTYDINYDDGEREIRVDEKLIRSEDGGGSGGGKGGLKEGDKIEARYRGKEKLYPGKITRDRGDGTFDIDYDDGEKETRVDEKLIRSKDGGSSSSGCYGSLMVGDKVEARYRGREKFYTGKIIRDRGDGTFDIDYDDGEKETRVDEKLIRSKDGGASSGGGNGSLMVGDKVEARYRGREKFYPGKIARSHVGGTYDIDYDDGEKETRVEEKLIRSKDGGSSSSGGKGGLKEGDKVEARYRGKEKLYPGKISRDRGDGTFDIDYDDGEKETRVDEKLIRAKDGGGGGGTFDSGDAVEARYRGREKYYPGKITRAHVGGTYDIDYDDGERETRVDGSLVRGNGGDDRPRSARRSPSPRRSPRRRSPSPVQRPSASRSDFREGDRVEARFRGQAGYFPGVVRTDRGDGMYDVSYDDGATETRVRGDLMRAGTAARASGGAAFEAGDVVEARFRGRDFRPARVDRARVNGTYDVAYESGERETRIDSALLRRAGAAPRQSPSRGRGDDDRDRGVDDARLKDRLRDLEDRLADERGRSRDGGGGSPRRSRDGDDVAELLRENRDMRLALESSGGARHGARHGGARHVGTRPSTAQQPYHALVSADDDVIDELCTGVGGGHGSVGQWLSAAATPLEKRNFIEFVQTLEDFEGQRGLTPAQRPGDDGSGTIHLALGPTIRVQLKFIV